MNVQSETRRDFDAGGILAALPDAVLVFDVDECIVYANQAAEQMLETSAAHLIGTKAGTLLSDDSPILAVSRQVRRGGASVADHAGGGAVFTLTFRSR